MQRDFTIKKYKELCNAMKENYKVVSVLEYLLNPPEKAVILRHDVDVDPNKALEMALLENKLGISATYYFRVIPQIFKPEIIKKIRGMGHEIGYHYEVLDKAKGDFNTAIKLFEQELENFREVCDIKTICMHGNPLSRWNNRDLWEKYNFRDYGILGEAYMSLDYSKVMYFTETGRDWSGRYSLKDRVTAVNPFLNKIESTDDIIALIRKNEIEDMCILVHPKRWSDSVIPWLNEFAFQSVKNISKLYLKRHQKTPGFERRDKLRVLVDVGHPAHVHFFKNMIWNLEEKGHEVKITARDKEISLDLLDAYGFRYENLGKSRRGLVNKAFGMVTIDYNLYKITRRFKPDILTGIGSMYAAQVGGLINKPSIIFTDTEHAKVGNNWLTFPFTTTICTPSCFKGELGRKQVRYDGYHELAYLHPNYFKPDPLVLDELNLTKNDKFIILRFVSWEASHDIGHTGFTTGMKLKIVNELEEHARVFITSEAKLTKNLEKYRISVSSEKIHDLLYYATMYIGEGATMASEAAVLGTPSLYVNPLSLGYISEESEEYGLVHIFSNQEKGQLQSLQKALELLQDANLKREWQKKREKLLEEKIDVTGWMTEFIENYPNSLYEHTGGLN